MILKPFNVVMDFQYKFPKHSAMNTPSCLVSTFSPLMTMKLAVLVLSMTMTLHTRAQGCDNYIPSSYDSCFIFVHF